MAVKLIGILQLGMVVLVLLGCSPENGASQAEPSSTVFSSAEAVISPTGLDISTSAVTPIPARQVTATKNPVVATIHPTYLQFNTVTPTATLNPAPVLLKIIAPGPMSKVISPVDFVIHIAPNFTGTTRIELIGEDGTDLYRKIFKTYSNVGYFTRVSEKINYEIRGAAEIGRLQVSTVDSLGRIQAHNSVRILLQSVGDNQITAVDDISDRVILRMPAENEEVRTTPLVVGGEIRPINDQPWVLELLDEKGGVVGSRVLKLASGGEGYQLFSTQIPYKVDKKTAVRLIIRQSDDRIAGTAYLYSRLLVLQP